MAQQRALPEYDHPPLNEVVFGVQFEALKMLRAAHLGTYWGRIRSRYPHVEEHLPVAHMIEKPELATSRHGDVEVVVDAIPLVPRCWYLDEGKLQLIQVQPDRFLRNWRQLEGKEQYPRYPFLSGEFREEWQGFLKFLDDERIGSPAVDQCELTYINHLAQGETWNEPAQLSRIFKFWSAYKDFELLPSPEGVSLKMTYVLPEQRGRLHVVLKQAIRSRDRRTIFVLDLTARGAPSSQYGDDIVSWFDFAHEWIVRAFTDLTTSEMHKLWGRTR